MKNKKLTITIGIPAYNEEENIYLLLKDVLKQKLIIADLRQVIVVSDGSTDGTVGKVKKIKTKKINVIENKSRYGLAKAQNTIIENTNSDILIILNADIRLPNLNTLEKMISPIIDRSADLVAPSVVEAEPETFFEKILFISTKVKNEAYEEYNEGKNVYTCRGLARAFSKKIYKKIFFTSSVGEDAFSYFYCLTNNFNYFFAKDAKISFRLPNNLEDHKKQSIRFFRSQEILKEKFGKGLISKSYRLPKLILAKSFMQNFTKYPIYTCLYLITLINFKFQSLFQAKSQDNWEISKSSKKLSV